MKDYNESLSDMETSTIAADMVIQGDIKTGGNLNVLGSVTGNIEIKGTLTVEGIVMGNTHSATFFAGTGKITGDILADDGVDIKSDAVIMGNISGADVGIDGAVKGNIDAHNRLLLGSTAKVKGDIKSGTMVMESGAIIDGTCTQCYASMTADKFFERLEHPEEFPDEVPVNNDTNMVSAEEVAEGLDDEFDSDELDADQAELDLETEKFIRSVNGEEVPESEAGAGSTVRFLSDDFEKASSM